LAVEVNARELVGRRALCIVIYLDAGQIRGTEGEGTALSSLPEPKLLQARKLREIKIGGECVIVRAEVPDVRTGATEYKIVQQAVASPERALGGRAKFLQVCVSGEVQRSREVARLEADALQRRAVRQVDGQQVGAMPALPSWPIPQVQRGRAELLPRACSRHGRHRPPAALPIRCKTRIQRRRRL